MSEDTLQHRAATLAPAEDATTSVALSVLGVPVTDMSMDAALATLEQMLAHAGKSNAVFFVNAHTLNLACDEPRFGDVLRSAERVFGDGTGVRWAVRILHGHALRDNVNGTDRSEEHTSELQSPC